MISCNNPQSHCNIFGSSERYEASVKQHEVASLNLGIFLGACQTYVTSDVDFQCIINIYSGTRYISIHSIYFRQSNHGLRNY